MAGKFSIKSRAWNIGSVVGSIVLVVVAFGGLFLLQVADAGDGTPTLLFVIFLGIVTFLLFAGPGIVYSARKRIGAVKSALPGGTMAWIRSHLYLPILALVAAFVHASSAPFRAHLSSGKLTLLLGILVSIAGLCRHHLIGVQKEALNVNVKIGKLATGQPREFRRLVTDLTENRRPLHEIEAEVATLDERLQSRWREIRALSDQADKHFPRTGGQRPHVRHYKAWKALHPPLTIALFIILGYHVYDVLGGSQALFGDEKTEFASADQCASCHSGTYAEWKTSAMAHAQNGTITVAQLPVTLAKNRELAEERGPEQQRIYDAAAKVCVNCHSPVGARFADEIDDMYPLDADSSRLGGEVAVSGGGKAVQDDGVSCIVCHTQESKPAERAGFGVMDVDTGGAMDYGTVYGPIFDDPNPLPQRFHTIEEGDDAYWSDPIAVSEMCGACHNVKADMDGDEPELLEGIEENLEDDSAREDSDGDFILDQNELDGTPDSEDDPLGDLVLQTTYDEWQDYVVGFDERFADDDLEVDRPLGCVECHMPTKGDGTQAVVDHAPGVMTRPERPYRSHSFVGVDYDLDEEQYEKEGLPSNALEEVLAERKAFLASSATLEVIDEGVVAGDIYDADVVVTNNLLGHGFPTGFAFARQFFLEVFAETADGEEVCLAPLGGVIEAPCASGDLDDPTEDLPQCDPLDIADVAGVAPEDIGNFNIEFAAAFPVGECDPWLTNFQKILTDGDPDEDGVFTEVAYQSFLPDIVKTRVRVANQQRMDALQSVRLNDAGEEIDSATFRYQFDTADLPDGEEIVVTARLRFRHLPPSFVRALDEEHDDLDEDELPDEARIEPEELLANMVIDDLTEARSGEGVVLACEGPQNEEGASILECIDEEDAVGDEAEEDDEDASGDAQLAAADGGLVDPPERTATLPDRRQWLLWLVALAAFGVPAAVLGRRTRTRR